MNNTSVGVKTEPGKFSYTADRSVSWYKRVQPLWKKNLALPTEVYLAYNHPLNPSNSISGYSLLKKLHKCTTKHEQRCSEPYFPKNPKWKPFLNNKIYITINNLQSIQAAAKELNKLTTSLCIIMDKSKKRKNITWKMQVIEEHIHNDAIYLQFRSQ